MSVRKLPPKPPLLSVTSRRRQPPTSVKELTFLLELELELGRRDDFCRRLDCALNDAFHQGIQYGRTRH